MELNPAEASIHFVSNDNEIIRESFRTAQRFSEIFERHIAAVTSYVVRRVGPSMSDDIVSETFLIAFRKRRRFDLNCTSALPWLLGIATKVVSQHRRAEANHWRALQATIIRDADAATDEITRSSAQMDAVAELERLFPRIAALSTAEREVLFLYAWGDLTYEEVAMALKIPVGTVRSRLSRVRAKLSSPPPTPEHSIPVSQAAPTATTVRFARQELAHGRS